MCLNQKNIQIQTPMEHPHHKKYNTHMSNVFMNNSGSKSLVNGSALMEFIQIYSIDTIAFSVDFLTSSMFPFYMCRLRLEMFVLPSIMRTFNC